MLKGYNTIFIVLYYRAKNLLEGISKHKKVNLLSDFNAKVGFQEEDGVVIPNNNGYRLADICEYSKKMSNVIEKRDIHKYKRLIIDYVVCNEHTKIKSMMPRFIEM